MTTVTEARRTMDSARRVYEMAHKAVQSLEAEGVESGPMYDDVVASEREAGAAMAEAEAVYERLSNKAARLRTRVDVYAQRIGADGLYQQLIEGAVDGDIRERIRKLQELEIERQADAIEEAAALR